MLVIKSLNFNPKRFRDKILKEVKHRNIKILRASIKKTLLKDLIKQTFFFLPKNPLDNLLNKLINLRP